MGIMTEIVDANKRNRDRFTHIVCKEYIAYVNIVMYFTKNFYLIDPINEKLDRFLSAGIFTHIIERYVDMRYWNFKEPKKGPRTLEFKHLHGAFVLWSSLALVSVGAFLIELLIHSVNNRVRLCEMEM